MVYRTGREEARIWAQMLNGDGGGEVGAVWRWGGCWGVVEVWSGWEREEKGAMALDEVVLGSGSFARVLGLVVMFQVGCFFAGSCLQAGLV